jgi:chaperonin GroEL
MGLYEKSKAKDIVSDKAQLNDIVRKTMSRMAKTVGATLGPGGRPVLIERDGLSPLITKDGVTVARSLGLDKAEDNIVIESAKEICINTAKEAGDGTTTAIIMANAIIEHGVTFMSANPKYNPQRIVSELEDLYEKVIVSYLKQHAVRATEESQLTNVALISSNGDSKIAQAVVEAVMAAGDDGTVLIEEGQGDIMRVETVGGYIATSGLKDLGQLGTIFINDRSGQQARMDNGLVFLFDGSMNDLTVPSQIQDVVEGEDVVGVPLIIFAHDFSDIVVDRFAKAAKGGLSIVPVKTPRSGLPNSRSEFLRDMSAYTGAQVYDPGNFTEADINGFGEFLEAKVNLYETFLRCESDLDTINARVKELKSISDQAFGEMDKMHVRASIGKLTGGVSTIFVGAASELKIREKKARVEDAVEAVRSAIAEGIIPGGCAVQLALAELIDSHPDKKLSWEIMVAALRQPFRLLLENCGEDADEVWSASLHTMYKDLDGLPQMVFDAKEHVLVNPFEKGIIEPAKVCRVALSNALEVASLLMTLGGIVVVPRDSALENQLEQSKQMFQNMMSGGGVGQQ